MFNSKLKNFVLIAIAASPFSAHAMLRPSLTILLGKYTGECQYEMAGGKYKEEMTMNISESDSDKTITIKTIGSVAGELTMFSLVPEVLFKQPDVDNPRLESQELLTISLDKRKWTYSQKTIDSEYPDGLSEEILSKFNFSEGHKLKIDFLHKIGGDVAGKGQCLLNKHNMRTL